MKYVQQDYQGSVRATMNAGGFVVSRTDYHAFGETIASGTGLRSVNQGYGVDSSTRQSYGASEIDESSGQRHTWFRKLEPRGGRWGSPDPYKGSISLGDPQSLNRYAYVRNEPTNFVDPSGLRPNCPDGTTPVADPVTGQNVCVAIPSGTVTVTGTDLPIDAGAARLVWRNTRMQNSYGLWINSGFVHEPYSVRFGEQTPFQSAMQQCLKDKVTDRLSKLNRERQTKLDLSILGSMTPHIIPAPFPGALNLSLFPDSINNDKDALGKIAIVGILKDPLGTGGNVLAAAHARGRSARITITKPKTRQERPRVRIKVNACLRRQL